MKHLICHLQSPLLLNTVVLHFSFSILSHNIHQESQNSKNVGMFSNSLIMYEEKTKEITTVKDAWISNPYYDKIRLTFALNFSKNY